jgi:hypothetical protein
VSGGVRPVAAVPAAASAADVDSATLRFIGLPPARAGCCARTTSSEPDAGGAPPIGEGGSRQGALPLREPRGEEARQACGSSSVPPVEHTELRLGRAGCCVLRAVHDAAGGRGALDSPPR